MSFTPILDGKLYPSRRQITADNLRSWIGEFGPISGIKVLNADEQGCFYAEVSFV